MRRRSVLEAELARLGDSSVTCPTGGIAISGRIPSRIFWILYWATGIGNPGCSGCDTIFHARSRDLDNWEVCAGDGRWDATMDPKTWVPVITADNKPYDDWHNGDPSVVYKDSRYFMALSTTGSTDKVDFHPNNICCA